MAQEISNLTNAASGDSKMSASQKEASRVRNLWVNAKAGRRMQWQRREQKSYDFALNDQLTAEEQDALEQAGMPTFIINRITPIIETMKYFVTAKSPRWKAVGVDGSDAKLAQMHTDIIDYCWGISDGQLIFSQVVWDSLVKSKGYFLVHVDPHADRGLGEVKISRVDPFHVYTNSMTYDPLERDAQFQIIKKDLPRRALMDMLPEYKRKIKKAQGSRDATYYTERELEWSPSIQEPDLDEPLRMDGSTDDVLPYYEVYEPEQVLFYNATVKTPPTDKEMREAQVAIQGDLKNFEEELRVGLAEKKAELDQAAERGEIIPARVKLELRKAAEMAEQALNERRQLLLGTVYEESTKSETKILTEEDYAILKKTSAGKQIVDAVPFYERRIKKTCVVGDQHLYSVTLNISFMPLIAVPYMHTGTPYPMSAVTPLVGKQREINKAHQIMVHHANLSSNMRWLAVEGEIDNEEWMQGVGPSGIYYYRPGMSASGPREVFPQPINNAFFTIEQDSKTDLEYMAGIHPPSMGITGGGGDETYRGFLAKDEYGTRRVKAWVANVVEPALVQLGRVFTQLAQDTYSYHKIFRIVQPNDSGGFSERTLEINAPVYSDMGDVIGRFNDYPSTNYDLRVVAGSTLPVNRWAVLEEYKQYIELGVIDDIAFLKETDLKDKEQIIERNSMLSKLRSQLENMESMLKEKDGTIETLSRQLVQMGIKLQVNEATKEIDRSKTEVKALDKINQERMRDALKLARDQMKINAQKMQQDVRDASSKAKKSKNE